MRRLISSFILLATMLALSMSITGCGTDEPYIRRDFDATPLQAIPSGADRVLQINWGKILKQPLTKGLIDEYYAEMEIGPIKFQDIQRFFGIDPMLNVRSVVLADYNTADPDPENISSAGIIVGNFTEENVHSAISNNAVTVTDEQYKTLTYKSVEMLGDKFYYTTLSPREIIFASEGSLLCRIIEIHTGGTDYVENDEELTPLLNYIADDNLFWTIWRFQGQEMVMTKQMLMGLGENGQLYPIENAKSIALQLQLDDEFAVELNLLMENAGDAQRLVEGINTRIAGLNDALNLIEQQEGVGKLELLKRFLNLLRVGNETECFKLRLAMPTAEFEQTFAAFKELVGLPSPSDGKCP